MGLLTKQEIMVADDMRTEDVDVPEWGGTVRVRTLSGRERDAFEASLVSGEGKKRKADLVNVRAKLVGSCLVDENGKRVFTDAEISFLGAKSAAALDRVFTVCQRLNGLSAADVEDLEKNSEAGPSELSPSTSASPSV
jgi:hypothetical protein